MTTVKEAVAARFVELMKERNIKTNELANRSGVTPSSVYSMLDPRRKEVSVNLVKKLCDGLEITLGEFFSAPVFWGQIRAGDSITVSMGVRIVKTDGVQVFEDDGIKNNPAPALCEAGFCLLLRISRFPSVSHTAIHAKSYLLNKGDICFPCGRCYICQQVAFFLKC